MSDSPGSPDAIAEDGDYILGDDVTDMLSVASEQRRSVLQLELDGSDDLLDRLDALSELSGQSYEEIVRAALVAYPPLAHLGPRGETPTTPITRKETPR